MVIESKDKCAGGEAPPGGVIRRGSILAPKIRLRRAAPEPIWFFCTSLRLIRV